MPISWNEIRQNAIRFSREWSEEHREDAEAKSFWDEFFPVFGMRRRLLATFDDWPSGGKRVRCAFAVERHAKRGWRVSRTTTGKPNVDGSTPAISTHPSSATSHTSPTLTRSQVPASSQPSSSDTRIVCPA